MFALLAGYQYRSSAVVGDQPPAADADDVRCVDELRGQPGTRVPHVWVRHRGQRVSTLDLLGPGFTLLTGNAGAAWLSGAASTSAALGIPLTVHRIGAAGVLKGVREDGDRGPADQHRRQPRGSAPEAKREPVGLDARPGQHAPLLALGLGLTLAPCVEARKGTDGVGDV